MLKKALEKEKDSSYHIIADDTSNIAPEELSGPR